MQPTPINMAEAIFEPFWDPTLSGLPQWRIEPGTAHGLSVYQNWCYVSFEWARKPEAGPALRMSRTFDLDCRGYDRLIVSIMAPEGAVVRIHVSTDRGDICSAAPPAPKLKHEHVVELNGASRLHAITLEVDAADDGIAFGWLNWIGLDNSTLLPRYLAQWQRFDAAWEGYLQPADVTPGFTPSAGLLITAEELERLRERHAAVLARTGTSPFLRAAQQAAVYQPEEMIGEFVNFWDDTRYNRERDHGKLLLKHGPAAAIAGLLLNDANLLRLGARYALAIAMCDHWDDGFICAFPGSSFEHRSFVQSLCALETALILDLAGELFTPQGHEYLLRRIAEAGLGNINFVTWKHEYIFHNNQLAWFTPGRMLGYLTLEATMPRVKPYSEIAYHELVENLDDIILPDGGYVEGPTYFGWVTHCTAYALHAYARARETSLAAVLPESILRCAGNGAVLASTDDETDVIPICDGRAYFDQQGLALLAAALPQSYWVTLYRKSVARSGGMPESVIACVLDEQIPQAGPALPAFTLLPETGILASVRQVGTEQVKLFVKGNHAGALHAHEDVGSFVLEFGGETFALDPGTCDYSSPIAQLVKYCERHTMLVPTGTPERPHPANPLPVDVKPRGDGDDWTLHVRMDLAPGWEDYYRSWVREWESPAPDRLTIRDRYALKRGTGVDFYWQTRRDVQISGTTITLSGKRGQVIIHAPEDTQIHVDTLPLFGDDFQRRITIHKPAAEGVLELDVHLRTEP